MNIDERMEEMRRRMEERMQKSQYKMDSIMNKYGLDNATYGAQPTTSTTINNDCIFCPVCGAKCDADACFCMQCGTRLITDQETDDDNIIKPQKNTNEELEDCPINFENFEGCGFKYSYEIEGEEKVLEVIYESCSFEDADGEEFEELCWCIDGESVDISNEDFRGCEDIHDCGVVIAKKLNIQHDGKVMMSFGRDGMTFTDVAYEICLDENLDYFNDDEDTVMLSLYANCGRDIVQTMFYEIDEDDIDDVKEAFENEDTDEICNYLDCDFFCNETFDLWGCDDGEKLGYEITDCDGETIDDGEIDVPDENVFKYRDIEDNFAVTENNHPKYVIVTTDCVKRAYATFEMPANFNIGGISFVKNNNTEKNILDCEQFGDTATSITTIRYAGTTYYCEDMGDCGTIGDIDYFLYEWDEEEERYVLIARC